MKDGIRNLGQQVLEVIILAPAGVDEKVIDQRFGEMLPALIAPEYEMLITLKTTKDHYSHESKPRLIVSCFRFSAFSAF